MKPQDKDKLNECLEILQSTDLGLSLVWLWTWDTIKYYMEDCPKSSVTKIKNIYKCKMRQYLKSMKKIGGHQKKFLIS